jgi:hypothetical protein
MMPEEGDMGTLIAFPTERCSVGAGHSEAIGGNASVIILPVIRIERNGDGPSDGFAPPSSSSPRGKRRKR